MGIYTEKNKVWTVREAKKGRQTQINVFITGGFCYFMETLFCLLPSVKESVECVSIRGLERGGFVLLKKKRSLLKSKSKVLVSSKHENRQKSKKSFYQAAVFKM